MWAYIDLWPHKGSAFHAVKKRKGKGLLERMGC
jgi:hypothetical protein